MKTEKKTAKMPYKGIPVVTNLFQKRIETSIKFAALEENVAAYFAQNRSTNQIEARFAKRLSQGLRKLNKIALR